MKDTFMIKTFSLCRWNSLFPEKMSLPVLFSLRKNGKYWKNSERLVIKNSEKIFGIEELFIGK